MGKKIEDYTDKELDEAIKKADAALRKGKEETRSGNKAQIDANQRNEDYLRKLHEERHHRISMK